MKRFPKIKSKRWIFYRLKKSIEDLKYLQRTLKDVSRAEDAITRMVQSRKAKVSH